MRYEKTAVNGSTRYKLVEENFPLFGCNVGTIPKMMVKKLPNQHATPYTWHVDVSAELRELDANYADSVVVIDLKPEQPDNLSLYELLDVWGCSYEGWSPLMLLLAPLFIDADPKAETRDDFEIKEEDAEPLAYTFAYARGGVQKGQLAGTWNPQRRLNAPMLWADAMQHFVRSVMEKTPEMLKGV